MNRVEVAESLCRADIRLICRTELEFSEILKFGLDISCYSRNFVRDCKFCLMTVIPTVKVLLRYAQPHRFDSTGCWTPE